MVPSTPGFKKRGYQMGDSRLEQYSASFVHRNRGRIPIVLDLEPTLIRPSSLSNLPESPARFLLDASSAELQGRRRGDIESLARVESRGLHWAYYACALVKSLCHDPRFAPVIVSPRLREVLIAKIYRGRIQPDILASTVLYDSRQIVSSPGWQITSSEKNDFTRLLSLSKAFPNILTILSQRADSALIEHAHCIALENGIGLEDAAHYVARDLREAQDLIWRLVSQSKNISYSPKHL